MIPRTTWDDLFPRANPGDETIQGIVKETLNDPCWRCKRPTQWASLFWEAPICSFICDDLAWLEYGNEVWGVGWAERGEKPFQ